VKINANLVGAGRALVRCPGIVQIAPGFVIHELHNFAANTRAIAAPDRNLDCHTVILG
jgi:hypothetical protein